MRDTLAALSPNSSMDEDGMVLTNEMCVSLGILFKTSLGTGL